MVVRTALDSLAEPGDTSFDRLERAILASGDNGEMITKWAVVVETMDMDGDRGVKVANNREATLWDLHGLYGFADERVKARIHFLTIGETMMNDVGDDDDDDE